MFEDIWNIEINSALEWINSMPTMFSVGGQILWFPVF